MASPFRDAPSDAWRKRYGRDLPEGLPDLATFLNHRSVRKFLPQPIPESIRQALIAAAQSAATSSNLQLWSAIEVDEPARREAMALLCADQSQVRHAGWFLAFIADHHRLREAASAVGESCEGLDYAEFLIMALVDVALAAERLVAAAEALGLGTCYIGALRNDPEGVRDLLELPPGTFGVFGLCVGYPAEPMAAAIKPRLLPEAVWFRETYPTDLTTFIEDYDQRMRGFYSEQGMKGDATWTMRSGRRVDGHHMTGREVLLEFLHRQGFLGR